jgi:hypothetical protein
MHVLRHTKDAVWRILSLLECLLHCVLFIICLLSLCILIHTLYTIFFDRPYQYHYCGQYAYAYLSDDGITPACDCYRLYVFDPNTGLCIAESNIND